MATTYKNIPVDEDTYVAVQAIAESNGFGKRGMGRQVKDWAARDLAAPVCDHPKTPVEVQWMPDPANIPGGSLLVHRGWFCATCNRVYRQAEPTPTPMRPVALETAEVTTQDPYGQPIRNKSSKRRQIAGRNN